MLEFIKLSQQCIYYLRKLRRLSTCRGVGGIPEERRRVRCLPLHRHALTSTIRPHLQQFSKVIEMIFGKNRERTDEYYHKGVFVFNHVRHCTEQPLHQFARLGKPSRE